MPRKVNIHIRPGSSPQSAWKFPFEETYILTRMAGWRVVRKIHNYHLLTPPIGEKPKETIVLIVAIPTLEEAKGAARRLHLEYGKGRKEVIDQCHGWPVFYTPRHRLTVGIQDVDPFTGERDDKKTHITEVPATCQIGFFRIWGMRFDMDSDNEPILLTEAKTEPPSEQPGLFAELPCDPDEKERLIGNDYEAEEWRTVSALHERHERNPTIVREKKQRVLIQTGKLACEVCGFDFVATYGNLGEGFAECHHQKPVAMLQEGEVTKLADLIIVCSNCHRMLHRDVGLTPESLRNIMGR